MLSSQENKIYKQKYSSLKKLIKKFVYENAALCDQVYQLQEKIICIKEERMYLLKRSYSNEHANRPTNEQNESSSTTSKTFPSGSLQRTALAKKPDANPEKWKTRKPHPTSNKRKTVVPVPVDSSGLHVYPINLGSLSIHSLGEIVTDRTNYHEVDVVYPLGFCSTRVYGSLTDPTTPCIYTCMVLDGGSSPVFQIDSDTDREPSITGNDINAVHAELLRRINMALGIEVVNTRGRGTEFFGLSHPTVLNLLQNAPGIKKCVKYKMTKFEVSRAGETYIEENDASLTFECLKRSITFSRSHLEEMEQQETLDSTATLRDLLNSA